MSQPRLKGRFSSAPILDRLMCKMTIKSNGCWEWTASLDSCGYGHIFFAGKLRKAHRVAYELLKTPIPEGYEIDHLCRNRRCINPEHMEIVSHAENMRRSPSFEKRRLAKRCKRGHSLSDAFINKTKSGISRQCRQCTYLRKREARIRRPRKEKP